MTTGREALRREAIRNDRKRVRLEEAEVVAVWTHTKPDDQMGNLCDVILVMEKPILRGGKLVKPRRYECVPLQRGIGHGYGDLYVPRVGDFVMVLLDENEKGYILGESPTEQMLPVTKDSANPDACRGGSPDSPLISGCKGGKENTEKGIYDRIFKHCQWYKVVQKTDETFCTYPLGKNPICKKIFDDFRDEITVWECKKGHDKPKCPECRDIGHVCEQSCTENQNTWFKNTSSLLISRINKRTRQLDYPLMTKFHHTTGSRVCFLGYPEASKGRLWIENMVDHVAMGHIHFRPCGTISARSAANRASDRWGCGCTDESGALLRLVSPHPSSDLASMFRNDPCSGWLINEDRGNYVHVHGSDKKITLKSDDDTYILIEPGKITLHAAVVDVVHDLKVDGTCTHVSCSCG